MTLFFTIVITSSASQAKIDIESDYPKHDYDDTISELSDSIPCISEKENNQYDSVYEYDEFEEFRKVVESDDEFESLPVPILKRHRSNELEIRDQDSFLNDVCEEIDSGDLADTDD